MFGSLPRDVTKTHLLKYLDFKSKRSVLSVNKVAQTIFSQEEKETLLLTVLSQTMLVYQKDASYIIRLNLQALLQSYRYPHLFMANFLSFDNSQTLYFYSPDGESFHEMHCQTFNQNTYYFRSNYKNACEITFNGNTADVINAKETAISYNLLQVERLTDFFTSFITKKINMILPKVTDLFETEDNTLIRIMEYKDKHHVEFKRNERITTFPCSKRWIENHCTFDLNPKSGYLGIYHQTVAPYWNIIKANGEKVEIKCKSSNNVHGQSSLTPLDIIQLNESDLFRRPSFGN